MGCLLVHPVEELLDGAVPCGGSGKLQPFAIEPDKALAAYGAGALGPVHRPAHEGFRIRDWEQDGAAVMPRYEQEIPASGFPPVATGAGNIHGIAVAAPCRLKEAGNGGVADVQHWVHHKSPPWGLRRLAE